MILPIIATVTLVHLMVVGTLAVAVGIYVFYYLGRR